MFNTTTAIRYCSKALGITLLALLGTTGYGADDVDNAAMNYKNEIAACKNESPKNMRAACIAEAKKTLADYRRSPESYQQKLQLNKAKRCSVFEGEKRRDCESRVSSEAYIDGSVAEGGVLRESVKIVPVN